MFYLQTHFLNFYIPQYKTKYYILIRAKLCDSKGFTFASFSTLTFNIEPQELIMFIARNAFAFPKIN